MADITFMAMHGCPGEDGKIQATFDLMGIKYTGPNSLGCALSMNKLVAKFDDKFDFTEWVTPINQGSLKKNFLWAANDAAMVSSELGLMDLVKVEINYTKKY